MDLMTPFEWIKIVCSIVAFLAAVAVWLWGRDKAAAVHDARHEERLRTIFHAMNVANERSSKLSSYVQGLPVKGDLETIWTAINKLTEDLTKTRERVSALEQR